MSTIVSALTDDLTNEEVVNAIYDILEIRLVALGYDIWDHSGDPTLNTTFLQLFHEGSSFENEYGQRPEYNWLNVLIRAQFQKKTPKLCRIETISIESKLRSIDVSEINTGVLASTKPVTFVQHRGSDAINETPKTIVNYRMSIQYRERDESGD